MNSQEACINGNSMLLGTSSTCVKATKCIETSHGKGEGEFDIPTGEKKLNKHFICNEFTLIYPSFIYSQKLERNVKEYSSNILRYINRYAYMQYIYDMSTHRPSIICLTVSYSIFQ